MTLRPTGNGTATFSGTPSSANVGTNSVLLLVEDSANASNTQSFTIPVADVNPVTTGAVQGQVVDDKGSGIEGATVTLTPIGDVVADAGRPPKSPKGNQQSSRRLTWSFAL